MPGNGTGRADRVRCTDCLVISSICALLFAGLLLYNWSSLGGCLVCLIPPGAACEYAWAAAIGALVGTAELLSRYRDNPWRAVRVAPGLVFILFNGLCAIGALFVILHFHSSFKIDDPVMRVIVAGTGAMVVIRSKIFTLRQPNGSDVSVGPAFAVDTFLAAVNREVDRRLAIDRNEMAAAWSRRLGRYSFATAQPFIRAALASMQDMDRDEARELGETLTGLVRDPELNTLSDQVRFYMVGFDILDVFGERAFISLFTELEAHLQTPAEPPRAAN